MRKLAFLVLLTLPYLLYPTVVLSQGAVASSSSPSSSGGGGVNVAANFTWTGTHDFTGATVTAGSVTFSGPVLFPDGTSSAPGLAFSGDPDTGFYYAAGGARPVFVLGGAEVWRYNGSIDNWIITSALWRGPSDLEIGWSSNANPNTAAEDTGLVRTGAATLRVTDGSTGLGYITGGTSVEANTGAKTPTAIESGECYTNTGDADGSSITLTDDPTIGTTFCVLVTAAQTITIAPSSGESLYMDADQCVANMTAAGVGANTKIIAATGGSGAIWIATGHGFTCNDA